MTSLPVSKRRRVELQYGEPLPVELWVEILRRCEPLLRLRYVCRTWAKWIVSEPRLRRRIKSRVIKTATDLRQFINFRIQVPTIVYWDHRSETFENSDITHTDALIMRSDKSITDLTPYSSLTSLVLLSREFNRENTLTDLSPLRELKSVELNACTQLADLSPLRGVKVVKLFYCPNVKDVSALADAKCVVISGCGDGVDMTPLSKVRNLTIDCCNANCVLSENPMETLVITQHDPLKHLIIRGRLNELYLDMNSFEGMKVYIQNGIENLDIADGNYDTEVDLSGFSCARNVKLHKFQFKVDLKQLKSMRSLHLKATEYEHNIDIASVANQLVELYLESYTFSDVSQLSGINRLVLDSCFKIKDLAELRNVHTLVLKDSRNITLTNLCDVHTLALRNCIGIIGLDTLRNVHTLIMDRACNPVPACVKIFKIVDNWRVWCNIEHHGFSAIDKLLLLEQ